MNCVLPVGKLTWVTAGRFAPLPRPNPDFHGPVATGDIREFLTPERPKKAIRSFLSVAISVQRLRKSNQRLQR